MTDGLSSPRLVHAQARVGGDAGVRHVFVRDLMIEARIGVYKHERDAPQRLRVNFDLSVREGGPIGDKLANVVDYERIVLAARSIGEGRHINLVETLAGQLADMCLEDPRVVVARVRVEKLDVFEDVASVGVEIERLNETRLAADIEGFHKHS